MSIPLLFPRTRIGKSLDRSISFQTPRPNRYNIPTTSLSKKLSTPEHIYIDIDTSKRQEWSQKHIQTSPQGKNRGSLKQRYKTVEDELRETDDSVRPSYKPIKIQDFRCLKLLGKGRHGTVFLALHRATGFLGALKMFSKQQLQGCNPSQKRKLQESLIREFKIQSFLTHTHIIRVYSIFSDRRFVYLFMELGSDGQLFDLFQRRGVLKEEAISFLLRALLEAVAYLHRYDIIHRDLKPENIVLIHGFPKICDFGESSLCRKDKGELRDTLCGTPLYLSPEMLMGERYNQKIDIWALGAMGYELFTGKNPFQVRNKDELKRVVTQQFKMTVGSLEFTNFMSYCLKKKSNERPTAAKLLKHPFIIKYAEIETIEELCR